MKVDLKKQVLEYAKMLECSDDPKGDVYELIFNLTGISKTDILLTPIADIDESMLSELDFLVKKRGQGYPLQYILGEWDFCSRTFFVSEGVLIPRTETEEIVYSACDFLKNNVKKVVFDLCCGSGCIGISVAANNPDCKVYLFDVEDAAVELTEKNIKKFGIKNAVVIKYDIFGGYYDDLPKPDVILSNPPYVTKEEYLTLQTEIFYEPENAIVASGDALGFYRCIAEKWLPFLNENSFFMFESGEEQPAQIKKILDSCGGFDNYKIELKNDIFDICRFVKGENYAV